MWLALRLVQVALAPFCERFCFPPWCLSAARGPRPACVSTVCCLCLCLPFLNRTPSLPHSSTWAGGLGVVFEGAAAALLADAGDCCPDLQSAERQAALRTWVQGSNAQASHKSLTLLTRAAFHQAAAAYDPVSARRYLYCSPQDPQTFASALERPAPRFGMAGCAAGPLPTPAGTPPRARGTPGLQPVPAASCSN